MNNSINSQISFCSKAYPVPQFAIKTKRGRLNVAELTRRDLRRNKFMTDLTKFFCKNFASMTEDPNWKVFQNRNSANYDNAIQDLMHYYSSKILHKDDDRTLLLAKDKHNKIQGACLSYGLDSVPGAKEEVYYIDSIAVNPSYRGFDIGRNLLDKTLISAQKKFSAVFLAGDRLASGFYQKLGFVPLNQNDESQKLIIDYLSRMRSDYPKYIEFYTKSLQKNKGDWFIKCAKIISEM